MSKSFRYIIKGVPRGIFRKNYQMKGWLTTSKNVVQITAGEVKFGTTNAPPVTPPFQDFYYHLGDARVWVSNISPHKNDFNPQDPGGVEYLLHVDWESDGTIDVGVTITIEDDLPVEIDGYER